MSCLSDGRPEAGPGGQVAAAVAAARNPELLGRLKLPAGAPAGAVRAALNKKDGDGNLPIHRALWLEATGAGPELVRAMLDAGGEAMLGVPGDYKRVPLHCAARSSPFPAVVALLLARGPAWATRAKSATGGGGTPLAVAERFNTGPGAEEIKALLRAAMQ